ncbi:4Fe-4S ferredoxin, iron-sulfur-binding domain-co ntaining protein [Desulfonema ishimotonii]|uniref:4Fe-4S ferredoxin, iron-sulfur-binding domain-co ntaining protein n=1 Tax=Desulfonema ishimotonii TaxID=45657 RepID=A0A401FYA6_9BACT|nr:4Fe-4S dicluster domain-containing protein [Desulfonema ishimotonii]GBC61951.1 4Fe-4S ferredoxin, iron-sulfur-binding domain-co ntaining protein [Desulfonema ishimotonii]
MLKRTFLSKKPRFEYESVGGVPMEAQQLPMPDKVTLFLEKPFDSKAQLAFKIGDPVRTGQRIALYPESEAYVISSVTGTISAISPYMGDFGRAFTAISIVTSPEDEWDTAFGEKLEEGIEAAADCLGCIPGGLFLEKFSTPGSHIGTIVISGAEEDLLTSTNQYVVRSGIAAMNTGISALKKITGVHAVVVALPQSLMQDAGSVGGASGVELRTLDTVYPSGLPRMVMRDVFGQVVPADKTCEEMGTCFVRAESVVALGKAILSKQLPVTKTLTLIRKDLSRVVVEARIGTPFSDVFKAADISLFEKDRIIVGGPMVGAAVYSEDHPVCPDTDAIMVQDSSEVPPIADTPCINCGECVRICPADVPVNMLVRFLEARQYEDAADMYDLHSCVECGLCSFVCVSKIPIFQYIRLAKYELERVRSEEEAADV